MENAKIRPPVEPKPLNRLPKKLSQAIRSGTPPPTPNFYKFKYISMYTFVVNHLQIKPLDEFSRAVAQTTQSHGGCSFWGLENRELIFNP